MRSFNVFSDGGGDYRAVKQGWCWPAFFFGSIWALFSGLWLTALLMFPIEFVFSIVGNNAHGALDPYEGYDETARLVVLAVLCIPLVIRVVLGIVGNPWRARKLRRLGFSHVGRVKADGKAHAISLCKAGSSEAARQTVEPVAPKTSSLAQPAAITRHAEPQRPSIDTEPKRPNATAAVAPPHWLGWSIAALCILAVADMPYGYYQLLRLLVTGYMGFLAVLYFIRRPNSWAWVFAFTALLYNPIFVITMSKEFHALVNVLVAAAIAWEIRKLRSISASPSNIAAP